MTGEGELGDGLAGRYEREADEEDVKGVNLVWIAGSSMELDISSFLTCKEESRELFFYLLGEFKE